MAAARAVRQRDQSPVASGFEEVVDVFEFLGHELVVVAELEELGVGVLQQLDRGLGAGGRVVEEGRVPSDDREVAGIVRDAGLQDLLAFAFGEDLHFPANHLRDVDALRGQKFVGRGRAFDLAHVEDEVVLLQPFSDVGLVERGGGAFELLLDDTRGELFEVGVGGPAAGEFNECVPAAGEGKFELEADDAIIVVLDFSGEALATFQGQWLKGLLDRSALVAHVGGSLLETGFGLTGGEDLAELVEADLFADVELDEDQDGAAQGGLRLRRLLQLGGDVAGDVASGDSGEVAVHVGPAERTIVPERLGDG